MANGTKATERNSRANKDGTVHNANHNFLQATRDAQEHINHDLTEFNILYKIDEQGHWEKCKSFDANHYELIRYSNLFGPGIDARNERNRKEGHIERNKSVEDVYRNKNTAPMETILQISNTRDLRDGIYTTDELTEKLDKVAKKVIKDFQKKHGKNIEILDYALHVDEGVPHVHLRYCFKARDKFGYEVLNQSQALKEMGYTFDGEKSTKYNNALISFTDDLREQFYTECERNGIEIDREVVSLSHRQMVMAQYKFRQLQKDIENMEIDKALEVVEGRTMALDDFKKAMGREAKVVPNKLLQELLDVYNDVEKRQAQIVLLQQLKDEVKQNKRIQQLETALADRDQTIKDLTEENKTLTERLNNGLAKARGWKNQIEEKNATIERLENGEEIQAMRNLLGGADYIMMPGTENITVLDVLYQAEDDFARGYGETLEQCISTIEEQIQDQDDCYSINGKKPIFRLPGDGDGTHKLGGDAR